MKIVGVLNVSPESFYKGSIHTKNSDLVSIVKQMTKDGADIIDVGAMSTAPYLKTQISEEEEAKRLESVFRLIRRHTPLPLSVDTSRALPAKAALKNGAQILNDVTGFRRDIRLPAIAKKFNGVILMANPIGENEKKFKDPIKETKRLLEKSLLIAKKHKIPKEKIAVDPGIGFFRNTALPWWEWDIKILNNLPKLKSLGCPILVGLSRKSFIGHILNNAPPEKRLAASLAATLIAIKNGATLIRTHDVRQTKILLTTTKI